MAQAEPTPTTGAALSLADLNTTINHEPRVLDLRVAEMLGFARPRAIRQIIERNRDELQSYGEFATRRGEPGNKGGAPSTEYFLTEGQALVICALSRTPAAAAVRKALIDVFMTWRRGQATAKPAIQARPRRRRAAPVVLGPRVHVPDLGEQPITPRQLEALFVEAAMASEKTGCEPFDALFAALQRFIVHQESGTLSARAARPLISSRACN